jgi:hypothetical protein
MGKYIKRHIPTRHKANLRKVIKKKAQPSQRIWAKHLHGIDPGPSRDPQNKGDAEVAQPGCGRTLIGRSFGWLLLTAKPNVGAKVTSRFNIHGGRFGAFHVSINHIPCHHL